jgi:hypothetical protein
MMAAHLAFNDLVRLTTSKLTSVTGTATATPVAGEPIASAATRPLKRPAAWTVAGGASGGTVRIRMESATISRTIRVIGALGLELPAGATSINALIRNGAATAATGTLLAAANFARPYDPTQPWNVVWTFNGTAGNGVELVIVLPAGVGGTLRVGRIWGSESLAFPNGVDAAWGTEYDDTSVIQYGPQARTPSVYSGVRFRRRRVPLTQIKQAVALGTNGAADQTLSDLDAILGYLGLGRDVLVLPRDSSALFLQRLPLYGLIERAVSLDHDRGPNYSTSLGIAETI